MAVALLTGCSGEQGKTAAGPSNPANPVVPMLSWPTRQAGVNELDVANRAAITAAQQLIGPADAVKVFFDGTTPAGRVVVALVGSRGTTRFVWLRQRTHAAAFRIDRAVDGRTVLTDTVLGARYRVGASSFILAITQPTCKEILLSGQGASARSVRGYDGVFELSTATAYSAARAVLPGHDQESVPLTLVAAS